MNEKIWCVKPTLKEQRHMDKVVSLGCIACRKLNLDSPAEIHHIRNKTGMGKRLVIC